MTKTPRPAFSLIQLVLAVFVMAVLIRVTMHTDHPQFPRHARTTNPGHLKLDPNQTPKLLRRSPAVIREAERDGSAQNQSVEVMPLDPRHSSHGPLLARVLRRYYPLTTDQQVDDLVNTLPPSESQRIIVIIPTAEKPAPRDTDKAPAREADEHVPAEAPRAVVAEV